MLVESVGLVLSISGRPPRLMSKINPFDDSQGAMNNSLPPKVSSDCLCLWRDTSEGHCLPGLAVRPGVDAARLHGHAAGFVQGN